MAIYVLAAALLLKAGACENGDPWWLWRTVAQAVAWLEVSWIPSHEKGLHWKAPDGWCSEAVCRRLNSLADEAASRELAPYRAAVAACEKDALDRRAWGAAAVASQMAATQEYQDKFVELARSLAGRARVGEELRLDLHAMWGVVWLLDGLRASVCHRFSFTTTT